MRGPAGVRVLVLEQLHPPVTMALLDKRIELFFTAGMERKVIQPWQRAFVFQTAHGR